MIISISGHKERYFIMNEKIGRFSKDFHRKTKGKMGMKITWKNNSQNSPKDQFIHVRNLIKASK